MRVSLFNCNKYKFIDARQQELFLANRAIKHSEGVVAKGIFNFASLSSSSRRAGLFCGTFFWLMFKEEKRWIVCRF